MGAWNNWFHCNGNTYGTWLRGDPRGWRSRGHHEHVDGDYKNPPEPGAHDKALEESRRRMTRPKVELPPDARIVACQVMVESLLFRRVELIALSVGGRHWHGLARFDAINAEQSRAIAIAGFAKNRQPRFLIGIAKKCAARALSEIGLVDRGGVWAGRGGVKPIKDRDHQVNAAKYIFDHHLEGAAVWYLGNFLRRR